MVNRQTRDRASRLLKKFAMGEITDDDFADAFPHRRKDDRAIAAIYERLWFFWDDRHSHRLVGKHQLDPDVRELIRRCIAFLNSDLEYEWPDIERGSFSQALLRLVGLRKGADKRATEWIERMNQLGNFGVWPFIREEDYVKASGKL